MKKSLIVFILSLISSSAFSQYSEWKRYMPLEIGNAWYYRTQTSFLQIYYTRDYIVSDSIIQGSRYFKMQHNNGSNISGYSFVRIDSTNGNYIKYTQGYSCGSYTNNIILDSLASSINDQINCQYLATYFRKCDEIGTRNIFGSNREYKRFGHDGLIVSGFEYTKDFGLTSSCSGEPPPCSNFTTLIGCKINGVVYGDTITTSIIKTNDIIPEKFSLDQNFPNPFNPSTNIKFCLPKSQHTILKVFDITGREVATLVNKTLQAGEYNYQFASDTYQLSSGVYYYQLRAGEFVQTRKMVLVK